MTLLNQQIIGVLNSAKKCIELWACREMLENESARPQKLIYGLAKNFFLDCALENQQENLWNFRWNSLEYLAAFSNTTVKNGTKMETRKDSMVSTSWRIRCQIERVIETNKRNRREINSRIFD